MAEEFQSKLSQSGNQITLSLGDFFSLNALQEFFEDFIHVEKRSPDLEQEFRNYIDTTFLKICSMLLVYLVIMVIVSWPIEYLHLRSESVEFWVEQWHGGVIVLFTLMILAIKLLPISRKFPKTTILTGTLLALGWVGFCLANATQTVNDGGPWFYTAIVIPFLTIPMPFNWIQRLSSTLAITFSYLVGFIILTPDTLKQNYVISTSVVISGAVLASVVFGHVFYQLVRRNFFNEKKLEYYATHDQLTGLLEPDEMSAQLENKLKEAKRYDFPLSIAMVDLDHFKQINDSFGHEVGDEVLETVGSLIQEEVREHDIPSRYGGEEFTVIFPHTDGQEATKIVNRIRGRLKKVTFNTSNECFTVSFSAGVAEYDQNKSGSALIEKADESLYEAKENGRDCVVGPDD